jgi:metal-responsive CopG/Arc/MetJ family transcriptional regulator
MKTAISIPDKTFRKADRLARRMGVSRSELYARAVATFVETYDSDAIQKALNDVYDAEPSELDPAIAALQFAALPKESW